MEKNISNVFMYKDFNLDENRIGVCGVKEISKAKWYRTIGSIYLCKHEIK